MQERQRSAATHDEFSSISKSRKSRLKRSCPGKYVAYALAEDPTVEGLARPREREKPNGTEKPNGKLDSYTHGERELIGNSASVRFCRKTNPYTEQTSGEIKDPRGVFSAPHK